jgi:4-amino-4-deoxy-L-arabinose transferase-like glycosyltransferase
MFVPVTLIPQSQNGKNMTIYALVILTVFCSALCHYIAKKRGAKPVFWAAMGALLGPIALPFVFFSKPQFKQSVVNEKEREA